MRDSYTEMLTAANNWGPSNDPNRRWFLAGYRDQLDGVKGEEAPTGSAITNMSEWAAYNSGVVAALMHKYG